MLKIEQKVADFIDKYLLQIVAVFLVFVALYMRKATLYHRPFDMELAFYPEVPGYIHTAFYTQFVKWLSFIPIVPITTLKILITGFDILLAYAVMILLRGGRREKWTTKSFACFGLLLISPLVIEYGVIWLHIDSICLFLLIGAWLCFEKNQYVLMSVLLGLAVALQMQYIVIILFGCIYCWRKNQKARNWIAVSFGIVLALNVLSIILLNISWTDGLFSMVNWLLVESGSNAVHNDLLGWLLSMLGQYSYAAGVGAIIIAFKYGKYWKTALIVHVVAILYAGAILQYGYWYC